MEPDVYYICDECDSTYFERPEYCSFCASDQIYQIIDSNKFWGVAPEVTD